MTARSIVYCPSARFHHSGAHSVGQLAFRDKQMFWYQNMVRYARKAFFGDAKVLVLRLAILKGMGLRMLASCVWRRTARMCPRARRFEAMRGWRGGRSGLGGTG